MNIYLIKHIFLFLIIISFGTLNSCSVDKRLHNTGFHVKTKSIPSLAEKSKVNSQKSLTPVEKEKKEKEDISNIALEKNNEVYDDNDQKCDLIISIDGDEYEVLITEVSDERIRYKKCNNPDGPDFLMRRDKIFMIKYKNGDKDVFNRQKSESTNNAKTDEIGKTDSDKEEQYHGGTRPQQSSSKQIEPLALLSFFFAIGSIFIFGIIFSGIAVVTGIISISRIEKDNNKGGMFFAILGLILGLIIFALMLLVLMSL